MGFGHSKNAKKQKSPVAPTPPVPPLAHDELKVEDADEPSPSMPDDPPSSPAASMAGAREAETDKGHSPIDAAAPENTPGASPPGQPEAAGHDGIPDAPDSQSVHNPPRLAEPPLMVVEADEVQLPPSSPASTTSRRLQDYPRSSDRNLCTVYRLCMEYELMGHGQSFPDHHMRGVDFLFSKYHVTADGKPSTGKAKALWSKAKARVKTHTWKGMIRTAMVVSHLGKADFFQDLESQSPGLIAQLAESANVVHEDEGQLLFRQGDKAAHCFLLVSGQIGLSALAKDKLAQANKLSPRQSMAALSQLCTWTKAPREMKMPKAREHGQRFVTTEGFNSFSDRSNIGRQISTIEKDTVFGEKALENDITRSETAKCLSNCEIIMIGQQEYRDILRTTISKIKFFRNYLPFCAKGEEKELGGRHPATFFTEGTFKAGHAFLTEGIAAEARIFVIREGTVEFQRREDTDNDPTFEYQRKPVTASIHSRSLKPSLTWDKLTEGQMFCTLAAFPIQGYEPFSTVATCDCKVFYANASSIHQMPEKFVSAVRATLMQQLVVRLQRMRPTVPDRFMPPPPEMKSGRKAAWVEPSPPTPKAKNSRASSPASPSSTGRASPMNTGRASTTSVGSGSGRQGFRNRAAVMRVRKQKLIE